jgi:hypothetical protein
MMKFSVLSRLRNKKHHQELTEGRLQRKNSMLVNTDKVNGTDPDRKESGELHLNLGYNGIATYPQSPTKYHKTCIVDDGNLAIDHYPSMMPIVILNF